jgi:hypothetical protein
MVGREDKLLMTVIKVTLHDASALSRNVKRRRRVFPAMTSCCYSVDAVLATNMSISLPDMNWSKFRSGTILVRTFGQWNGGRILKGTRV